MRGYRIRSLIGASRLKPGRSGRTVGRGSRSNTGMSTTSHLLASPSGPIGWVAAVLVWVFVTWSHLGLGRGFVPNPLDALAVIAVAWLAVTKEEGWAFTAACLACEHRRNSLALRLRNSPPDSLELRSTRTFLPSVESGR